jgi:hypothetical protein
VSLVHPLETLTDSALIKQLLQNRHGLLKDGEQLVLKQLHTLARSGNVPLIGRRVLKTSEPFVVPVAMLGS